MSVNIPPSQMLRVPTPLVDAVKELSRLHRAGCTSAVMTGLQQLIASIDSSVDIGITSSGNKIDTALIAKLISSQVEPLQVQLEQIEQRLQLIKSTTESVVISTEEPAAVGKEDLYNIQELPIASDLEEAEEEAIVVKTIAVPIPTEPEEETIVVEAITSESPEEPAVLSCSTPNLHIIANG